MVELISDFLHELLMPFGPHSCITHTLYLQQGKIDKGCFDGGGRAGSALEDTTTRRIISPREPLDLCLMMVVKNNIQYYHMVCYSVVNYTIP